MNYPKFYSGVSYILKWEGEQSHFMGIWRHAPLGTFFRNGIQIMHFHEF